MVLANVIHTDRLSLRPIASGEADAVVAILRAPEVTRTYMVPDLDDTQVRKLALRLAALSCDNTHFVRGIYTEERLIGWLNDTEIIGTTIELGWAIHPSCHNKGFATEAVTAAIRHLLDAGYQEITAGAFEENKASIRVMEKAGMERIAKTDTLEYRGQLHRCIYYRAARWN